MNGVELTQTLRFPAVVISPKIPISLAPHLVENHAFASSGCLSFFRSVYHCTFLVDGKEVGVFIQLNEQDDIQDIFCQCEESQEKLCCPHMAEAVRLIFARSSIPLHRRFLHSPYYTLFSYFRPPFQEPFVASKELQIPLSEAEKIHVKGNYEPLLSYLESEQEIEDSSIKFSSLTEEELNAWYQKRPSKTLSFEISPLCDLARFLYMKEEREGKPSLSVQKTKMISFVWKDMEVSVPLPDDMNEAFFSSFAGYPGNIEVDTVSDRRNAAIRFDDGTLIVEISGSSDNRDIQWKRVKNRYICLYPKKCVRMFRGALLQEEALASFFSLEQKTHDVEWTLSFSEERGLLAQAYVRNGPKKKQKGTHFVGRLLFLEDGQSVLTNGSFFEEASFHVPTSSLPSFIERYRGYLSLFKGGYVHEAPLFKSISYRVDSQGALSFFREKKEKLEFLTFGSWALVPSVGFFSKETPPSSLPLNHVIIPHRVGEFIRSHRSDLKNISAFFAKETPIEGVELFIRHEKKSVVLIEPKIVWKHPSYQNELLLFDEFGYLPDIGFFELPPTLSLAREIDKSQPEEWNAFFEEELGAFLQRNDCHIDPHLLPPASLKLMCNRLDPEEVHEQACRAKHVWDVDFFWESSLGRAFFEEVSRAKKRGDKFLITDAGALNLHDSKFDWIFLLQNPKQKKVKTWDFLKIQAHDDVHFQMPIEEGSRSLVDKLLHDQPVSSLPSLKLLNSRLRSYQITGVKWLWMLYSFGLSGLLCDDMGVGKTHQAMALLAAVAHVHKKKPRYLIICPTSLIWHWREKIQSFLPSFSLFYYVGSDRSLDDFFSGQYDIFLTTYGIWRNEFQALRQIPFEIALFDELQIAKNHFSRIWSALSQVNAVMRIGLTGTPIENRLRELKALFDLIIPGYLPEDSLFRELYIKTRDEPSMVANRCLLLSRYVRPFILRRRKVDVLQDLPEKVEEKYRVDLLGEQATLYRQVASQQGGMLLQQLQDESVPIPYIHIFALLSSLKQICNHPATYLKQPSLFEQYESGKWDAFQELLEEALESDQKVVVFSQYLAMLDIMKQYLIQKNIGFSEIRGRTKDRGEPLVRFHHDAACRVFLGSLQAAGLGIDLTPARVVIHYDRWWNAARENQATDRVHRMGQEWGVQVCKLITRGTVEERIDAMIERKARLLEDVVAYDDHQVVKKLSRTELLELLQDLNEMQK